MDPASLNLNQAKMTGDFCAALRRGRVLRKLLKFQYVVRALSQAYGIGGPMDIMDKPDGLPTSPQGIAHRFGQAQQQKQNMINRIQAA